MGYKKGTEITASSPLKKGNMVLCEDANGNQRYMGSIEVKYATGEDGKLEWWPVEGRPRTKAPVAAEPKPAAPKGNQDPPPAPPAPVTSGPTVAAVIERLKATKTEEEAKAVIGEDTRVGVLKAYDKHIQTLKLK